MNVTQLDTAQQNGIFLIGHYQQLNGNLTDDMKRRCAVHFSREEEAKQDKAKTQNETLEGVAQATFRNRILFTLFLVTQLLLLLPLNHIKYISRNTLDLNYSLLIRIDWYSKDGGQTDIRERQIHVVGRYPANECAIMCDLLWHAIVVCFPLRTAKRFQFFS